MAVEACIATACKTAMTDMAAEPRRRAELFLEWHSGAEWAQRQIATGMWIGDEQAAYLEEQVAASRRKDWKEGHD